MPSDNYYLRNLQYEVSIQFSWLGYSARETMNVEAESTALALNQALRLFGLKIGNELQLEFDREGKLEAGQAYSMAYNIHAVELYEPFSEMRMQYFRKQSGWYYKILEPGCFLLHMTTIHA